MSTKLTLEQFKEHIDSHNTLIRQPSKPKPLDPIVKKATTGMIGFYLDGVGFDDDNERLSTLRTMYANYCKEYDRVQNEIKINQKLSKKIKN